MVKEPESMEQLIYFTNRDVGKGAVTAWVYKGLCPKCEKGLMAKPKNEKTGRPKIRATIYVCPECGYEVDKKEHEETLECEIKYTCPECGHKGETAVLFKRKTYQGMKAVVFQCEKCDAKIPITKKLKTKKIKIRNDDKE